MHLLILRIRQLKVLREFSEEREELSMQVRIGSSTNYSQSIRSLSDTFEPLTHPFCKRMSA